MKILSRDEAFNVWKKLFNAYKNKDKNLRIKTQTEIDKEIKKLNKTREIITKYLNDLKQKKVKFSNKFSNNKKTLIFEDYILRGGNLEELELTIYAFSPEEKESNKTYALKLKGVKEITNFINILSKIEEEK